MAVKCMKQCTAGRNILVVVYGEEVAVSRTSTVINLTLTP